MSDQVVTIFEKVKEGALLSDSSIRRYNREGWLIEQLLREEQIQPNSVDLTLGRTWKKIKPNSWCNRLQVLDPRWPIEYKEGVFEKGPIFDPLFETKYRSQFPEGHVEERYILQPGEFVLMASQEILRLPNRIVSFVCGRSSVARLAIQTEEAGLIDAGFRGTITLEMQNQNTFPIILYPGMRVAQVYFIKAEEAERPYGTEIGSKYSGQIEATESRIHLDVEFQKKEGRG